VLKQIWVPWIYTITTKGVFYANVVGNTFTALVPVCYAKVEKFSSNPYDDSRCFLDAPNDSSTTTYSKFSQFYDFIGYFLFLNLIWENEFSIFSKVF